MCSDDPRTIIVRTESLNRISDLALNGTKGTVIVEGGATFPQVYAASTIFLASDPKRDYRAEWLHGRNASLGYTLVNWNISLGWIFVYPKQA